MGVAGEHEQASIPLGWLRPARGSPHLLMADVGRQGGEGIGAVAQRIGGRAPMAPAEEQRAERNHNQGEASHVMKLAWRLA